MRKLGWTFPVAGFSVLLGGLMVGGLLGQSPHFKVIANRHAVELLSPEFEPGSLETFQTPVLELGLAPETVSDTRTNRLDLPVIESLPLTRTPEPSSFPVHQPIFGAKPISGLPVSPGFSTSQGIPHQMHGLPFLPHPILPGPGHSRALISAPPRPGHSLPKRLSESDLEYRPS